MTKKKDVLKIILLANLFILLISLTSAVSFDNSIVLNTSVSNTSLTFSVPITVSSVTIDTTSILLEGISCGNDAPLSTTTILFNTENTNFDSSVYCVRSSGQNACTNMQGALDSTFGLVILILVMVIIATVIGLLMTSFGVVPNTEVYGQTDLKTVLSAIIIVAAIGLLLIFVLYIFESGFCPAFGA